MTTRIYLAQGEGVDDVLIPAISFQDAADGLCGYLQADEPCGSVSVREMNVTGGAMQFEFWADEFTTLEYTITLPEFFGSVEDLAA